MVAKLSALQNMKNEKSSRIRAYKATNATSFSINQ
jgi:hypothetical protein